MPYEIVDTRATTVQTVTAKESLTGHTLTFRWEGVVAPTPQELARLFEQVGRLRSDTSKSKLSPTPPHLSQ